MQVLNPVKAQIYIAGRHYWLLLICTPLLSSYIFGNNDSMKLSIDIINGTFGKAASQIRSEREEKPLL